ncbi:MAG TPA: hypothetical protein VHC22_00385 [Pirellulales bacterium]|nr:hypothetical protein [Pirellulales bacterium]
MNRRFQFSLGALFVLTAIVAAFFAGMALQANLDANRSERLRSANTARNAVSTQNRDFYSAMFEYLSDDEAGQTDDRERKKRDARNRSRSGER